MIITLKKKIKKIITRHALLIIIVIAVALLALTGLFYVSGKIALEQNNALGGIILFYDDDCSYCAKVDDFIKDNKIEEKVVFTRLDIFHNEANYNLLVDRAQACGLDSSHMGVPFLWDGKNCVVGYVDIITFFQSKTDKKP